MKIAGTVELDDALTSLAASRPVFHSEADFQLALAWHIQLLDPLMSVRLETRPAPGVHLDLAFSRLDLGRSTAVELKYLTREWTGVVDGERFELKNHGAQDIRAYDVVKDVVRVEKFVAGVPGADGVVVVLANEASYWRPAKPGDLSNAAAFRVAEGTVLHGSRAWGPRTGPGTMKGRADSLDVAGVYTLRWADYSRLPGTARGAQLRRLVIEVRADRARAGRGKR